MSPDEVLVYTGMSIVPLVAGVTGIAALWAIRKRGLPIAIGCIAFVAAVPLGMVLSFFFVNAFIHLLHGDGVLAIVAAPVTGAILTIPVALIFAIVLLAFRR